MTDRTADYYATLDSTEQEIREGFAAHFAGKPGATLPSIAYKDGHDQVVYIGAQMAINEAADYDDTAAAFHACLTGSVTLEQFRAAIVARYIESNADDIVYFRTGLVLPSKSSLKSLGDAMAAPFPSFLMQGATA